MGNSDLSNSENILVKVDQNNLIYIDPNSVVDNNGDVQPRGLKQENLVMYANLEADLVPRSTLISSENQGSTLTSIAKGTLNFLRNQSQGGDGNFDTSWTDAFNPKPVEGLESNYRNGNDLTFNGGAFTDPSGQSFGMQSINVVIKGANVIPQVQINFVDIRGKTLFESAKDSPYRAFFHIPWPIFYLTIKGYYGKAIRYRLHMVKFSSRFNSENGNFEVSTTFVGSTYAYLNDISLGAILNSPYMFMTEKVEDKRFNTKTGRYEKSVSKSSRGYAILSSVYSQYKQKGLIPQDFPVKTLKELGYIAQSLDKILEQQIFTNLVEMKVFAGIKEMETTLNEFESAIKAWGKTNLSSKEFSGDTQNNNWYYLLGSDKTTDKKIVNKDENGTLERLINLYTEKLNKSILFTNQLKNNTKGTFDKSKINIKSVKGISTYYTKDTDGKIIVSFDVLVNDVYELYKSFNEQKVKLQDEVEKKMNEVIKSKEGFGFEPTIRNVFAVLLANAEVYVKLMKEVHNKSFESAPQRAGLLSGLTDEQKGKGPAIYPWPEVKKPVSGGKQNVIAYPGEKELVNRLRTDDPNLWPEVDFVEDYMEISTSKVDTNVSNEPTPNDTQYIFETDQDDSNIEPISAIDVISTILPYRDKTLSGYAYELYERAKYITLVDSFNNDLLLALAEDEYLNIADSIKEDNDVIDFTQKLTSTQSLLSVSPNSVTVVNGQPITGTTIDGYLYSLSPFERFNNLRDDIPTVGYIRDHFDFPISIEKYKDHSQKTSTYTKLDVINGELTDYTPESYRKNIYPFNSPTYLSYLNQTSFTDDNFKFGGILQVNQTQGFICSPINPKSWVKDNYDINLFNQAFKIGDTYTNILNTPYFHNQLLTDFNKTTKYGKYVGSSYLLLNSLPFKDLEDQIVFDGQSILMSSLFREIGSTHFIPYHLMLKWGSQYHRYKKYLIDSDDILDGFLNSSNVTQPIDGEEYFDNNSTSTFTIGSSTVTYSDETDAGLHPFYHAIYNQIVKGFAHYNPSIGSTSYDGAVTSNNILHRKRTSSNNISYWSALVDNSKYVAGDNTYTLLPSDGGNGFINNNGDDDFNFAEQSNFRSIWWDNETIFDEFSGKTFASHSEYVRSLNTTDRTFDNVFSIDTNYRKIIDLIGTFGPTILESFEELFLDFASEKLNDEVVYKKYENINFDKFQDVLTSLSVVKKESSDSTDVELLINLLKTKQLNNASDITTKILSSDNLLKVTLSNPKEIDPYSFYGLGGINPLSSYTVEPFSISDVTSTNQNFVKLYIGEDLSGNYINFFSVNDIRLTEENIILHRPLAQIYAGYIQNGGTATKTSFSTYLKDNILQRGATTNVAGGSDNRLETFLNYVINRVRTNVQKETETITVRKYKGYNTDDIKLELYNTFKSFNDKWASGNSIGQRGLLEEFLFLDKANRDIGDKFYVNLDRIKPLVDYRNANQNLYGAISMLIQGTGLDMRALPAYVNFYGTNVSNKSKITPSKKVAQNLFGTFLEVDYQESGPKIIIQLVGQSSKRVGMEDSKEYKFADDSFYIGAVNNNPLVITSLESFEGNDLSKSNKVVAFEVSFGDQNQGIFKGIQLDQASLKNTSESFVVLENLGRSESGAGAYNVDVGLFDYYKQASYTCEVECMGNVMIQPTMFFYLKNIPMFRGSYWITEVSHSIQANNIVTRFTGTRIPYSSLPDPKDSFVSSYRSLFDKISNKAIAQLKRDENPANSTETSIAFTDGNYTIDMGTKEITGEKLVNDVGVTPFGIPYNGFNGQKYIQKINYNNVEYFRAIVVKMGGENNELADKTTMRIANGVTWEDIKSSDMKFYSLPFQLSNTITEEKVRSGVTKFLNPQNKKTLTLQPSYQLTSPISVQGPVGVGPKTTGYGISMSPSLMKVLGLFEGDVVYFDIE